MTQIAKPISTKETEMYRIYKSFHSNLDSIISFVDALSPIAFEKDSNRAEQASKIIKDSFAQMGIDLSKGEEDGEGKKIKLTEDQLLFFAKELRKLPKVSVGHAKILYQSSFVLLVGYFEYLFADLLKYYHKHYPGSISDKPLQIVINELKSYDTVEDAIDYVITKEVEMQLFDMSFNELTEHFNKILKINLENTLINWDLINETRERRHIIVHNNSIINKKYLNKSKIEFLPDKDQLKIDENINVSNEYFNIALNEIYVAGLVLIFNCWRQWVKNDNLNVYKEIMNTSFECLKKDLNLIACRISFYSTSIEAKTNDELEYLLRAKFNYFIALKQLNKTDDLQNELTTLKVTTLSPIFKMAYYALKDDKEKMLATIPHCKAVDDMKVEWLHEWPLFKHIRQDIEFLKQLEEKYHNS